MKKWILFFAVFLFGCAQVDVNPNMQNSYKNMTVEELHAQLENKDFFLVDVHIPEQEHLRGTDAFIPYNEIAQRIDELPNDKDAKIVLYCRSGRMSEEAGEQLASLGYSNVYSVAGGMIEWDKKYESR